jgi:DNA-binding response OmpR family regulator
MICIVLFALEATKLRVDDRLQEMPVMDGYETARRLREMGAAVPILALTANAMAEQQDEFLAAGADAVLTKPAEAACCCACWRPSD